MLLRRLGSMFNFKLEFLLICLEVELEDHTVTVKILFWVSPVFHWIGSDPMNLLGYTIIFTTIVWLHLNFLLVTGIKYPWWDNGNFLCLLTQQHEKSRKHRGVVVSASYSIVIELILWWKYFSFGTVRTPNLLNLR